MRAPGELGTLLIVIGAGASNDSLPRKVLESISNELQANWRPPLARELFDDRASFGEVLDGIPECAGLIGELRPRIAGGASVEEELERIQDRASKNPRLQRDLMALRFYLQQVLWRCGNRWRDLSHGVTNYMSLVRRVDDWAHASSHQVCYVTFNYDLLLDEAIDATLGLNLNRIDSFIGHQSYSYVKFHGSVNWWRDTVFQQGVADARQARRVLLELIQKMQVTDAYAIGEPDAVSVPRVRVPAIAIPMERKLDFECPREHVAALDASLPSVGRILVLGWRGAERRFLDRLTDSLPGKAPAIEIVGASEDGTRETMSNLASVGLAESRMRRFTDGFTGYLETGDLERFLGGSPRMQPSVEGWVD